MGIIELLSNPIIGFVGTVGTVLGIVFAFVLYRKSKRDKEPHWSIQTVNLFKDYSGTVAGLDIQYLGEKVRDLSVSKVAFWNRGALTIDASDLVDGDRLRLEAKGHGHILSTKLISTNNAASQPLLSASLEKDRAFLRFEYLDRGQGFVLQVIHEGTSSNDLELKGAIKGAAKIRKIDLSNFIHKTKKEWIQDQVGKFFAGLVVVFVMLMSLHGAWKNLTEEKYVTASLLALFSLFILFVISVNAVLEYSKLTRKVPSGLEAFYTDPRQPET